MHLIKDIHEPMLLELGFVPAKNEMKSSWKSYRLDNELGNGLYRIYSPDGCYSIVIHDFILRKDTYLHCVLPEYLSITWYDSATGAALKPYQINKRGYIKGYHSNKEGYHAMVYKDIPIYSVGIEITPEYAQNYFYAKYPGETINSRDAFLNINEKSDFPEMIHLLHQVKNYKGIGSEEELFYKGKVHEAMSLLIKRNRKTNIEQLSKRMIEDKSSLESVTSYINTHITGELNINTLVRVACMSPTKLKKLFKEYHDLTITEYIQYRRIHQAKLLLSNTNMTVSDIAQNVGYRSAGRFAHLFKKYTGLLPSEYKRMMM